MELEDFSNPDHYAQAVEGCRKAFELADQFTCGLVHITSVWVGQNAIAIWSYDAIQRPIRRQQRRVAERLC